MGVITKTELAKLAGTSASRVRNYVAMGGLDTVRLNGNEYIADSDNAIELLQKRSRNRCEKEPDNCDEIKLVMDLTEIIYDYFPIENLQQSAYSAFHDRVVKCLLRWRSNT